MVTVVEGGCWSLLPIDCPQFNAPAIFLDRDGVIVRETHYLCRPADVVLIDGIAAVIAEANRRRVPVVVITNQAGVGRGYYRWEEFVLVQQEMSRLLAAEGAKVDAVFACAYHSEGLSPYRHDNHPWRKPNPGMLLQAQVAFALDLTASLLVGDALTDIQAARHAGIGFAALVRTGHGMRTLDRHWRLLRKWEQTTSPVFEIHDDANRAIHSWFARVEDAA